MRVLWISNVTHHEVLLLLDRKGVGAVSGGWAVSAAEELAKIECVGLYVALLCNMVKELAMLKCKRITYYFVPQFMGVADLSTQLSDGRAQTCGA